MSSEGRRYAREVLRGDPCTYCGVPAGAAIYADHIKPVCDGGSKDADNLTAVCESCNLAKSVLSLLLFLCVAGLPRGLR